MKHVDAPVHKPPDRGIYALSKAISPRGVGISSSPSPTASAAGLPAV